MQIWNTIFFFKYGSGVIVSYGLYAVFRAAATNGSIAILASWYGALRRESQLTKQNAALSDRVQQARTQTALVLEHNRMARELHDVAGQHLSAITIQANMLLRARSRDDERAAKTLQDIRDESVWAMQSMRAIIGILRQRHEDADTVPQLNRLPALLTDLGEHSPDVDVRTTGDLETVDPNATLACYRVVQESVTNARRHAPGAFIQVRIGRGLRALAVEVENGPPRGDDALIEPGGGYGLVGMRERIGLLGGQLDTGPTDDGGWHLRASIPIDHERSGERE